MEVAAGDAEKPGYGVCEERLPAWAVSTASAASAVAACLSAGSQTFGTARAQALRGRPLCGRSMATVTGRVLSSSLPPPDPACVGCAHCSLARTELQSK